MLTPSSELDLHFFTPIHENNIAFSFFITWIKNGNIIIHISFNCQIYNSSVFFSTNLFFQTNRVTEKSEILLCGLVNMVYNFSPAEKTYEMATNGRIINNNRLKSLERAYSFIRNTKEHLYYTKYHKGQCIPLLTYKLILCTACYQKKKPYSIRLRINITYFFKELLFELATTLLWPPFHNSAPEQPFNLSSSSLIYYFYQMRIRYWFSCID